MVDRVMVAKESFFYTDDEAGTPKLVHKGERFREGHPVIEARTHLFEEDKSVHEYEGFKRSVGRPRKTEE